MATARNDTALEHLVAAIPRARDIVARVARADRHLADQLRRAITSTALNLAEADGNRDGNRRLRLQTAHGSANEAKAALRIAVAWGYVTQHEIDELFGVLDRAGAMTWSRMRNK